MRIRNLEQLDYVPCIMSYSTKRPAAVTAILELELEQFVGSFNQEAGESLNRDIN